MGKNAMAKDYYTNIKGLRGAIEETLNAKSDNKIKVIMSETEKHQIEEYIENKRKELCDYIDKKFEGMTVFLTREEAEKTLERSENGN